MVRRSLMGLEWNGIPPSIDGADAYIILNPLPKWSKIHLTSCEEPSTFIFALYQCAKCTGSKPAGLGDMLLLDMWEAGSCSPYFGGGFQANTFYKDIDAVTSTYTVVHNEILAVFRAPGNFSIPQCRKQHGFYTSCGVHCPSYAVRTRPVGGSVDM
eukprot:TRINITY_DN61_c2_g1_i3.p1 TRINITY_DN61_c2_g1~~TRINITY_DN61_c2_g1_i3.p1  ORF type:complete len:156 (+),score=20.94 TRINITY_DN61_c2_g1_i3:682-1149(+)